MSPERPVSAPIPEVVEAGMLLSPERAVEIWGQIWVYWGSLDRTPAQEVEHRQRIDEFDKALSPEAQIYLAVIVEFTDDGRRQFWARDLCVRKEAYKYGNTFRATRMALERKGRGR